MFMKRAGTLILATMIVVWALLYFPGQEYEAKIETLEEARAEKEKTAKQLEKNEEKAGSFEFTLEFRHLYGRTTPGTCRH